MVYQSKNLRKDLRVRRGDTFEENLEVIGDFILPIAQAKMQVRKYGSDFRVAFEPDVYIDGRDILFSKSAGATKSLVPGSYVYDVEVTDGEGDTTTIREGKFEVIQDVSR
ncbi:hypothetical protein [Persicitalea jodogahamensis]|uniref:Uncharacterized protein n=1 Tax=Persicitalea jodogahamensis TaxID=402147 RepID=A0A8J3D367_9BACT|nr:hypothetical protein [Persicitalea jodogahamensis]GHB63970.1 hypothetical protein GCM10007390_17300 [Persicitalea jodogahamensis]